jgi:hypothetical protein
MIAIPSMRPPFAWAALIAVLLVGACGQQSGPAPSRERVFAADMTGAARKCEAPRTSLTDGQTTNVEIKVANDGGWCGLMLQRDGRPYDSSLLTGRPNSGKVVVNRVGDFTRISYTPNTGFTGGDAFAVRLIPGDAIVRVTVIVTAN